MDFYFGAQAQQTDGTRLGELTRVVIDPETRTVDCFVVEAAHLEEREVKLPLESVDSTDDETVTVTLTREEFDDLPEYSVARNTAPPPELDVASEDVTPPVGAATGIESIAFVPIVEEDTYIPTGDDVLDRSTEVWATDGLVGALRAVLVDADTRAIGYLVVRHGTIFTHELTVPAAYIGSARTGAILLSVPRAKVEGHASH